MTFYLFVYGIIHFVEFHLDYVRDNYEWLKGLQQKGNDLRLLFLLYYFFHEFCELFQYFHEIRRSHDYFFYSKTILVRRIGNLVIPNVLYCVDISINLSQRCFANCFVVSYSFPAFDHNRIPQA